MNRTVLKIFFNGYFRTLIFSLALFSSSVYAVGLNEYHDKIQGARDNLEYLLYPDEEATEANRRADERVILAEVRRALSATEIVELKSEKLEIDNGWLLARLKEYEDEKDPSKRQPIL